MKHDFIWQYGWGNSTSVTIRILLENSTNVHSNRLESKGALTIGEMY